MNTMTTSYFVKFLEIVFLLSFGFAGHVYGQEVGNEDETALTKPYRRWVGDGNERRPPTGLQIRLDFRLMLDDSFRTLEIIVKLMDTPDGADTEGHYRALLVGRYSNRIIQSIELRDLRPKPGEKPHSEEVLRIQKGLSEALKQAGFEETITPNQDVVSERVRDMSNAELERAMLAYYAVLLKTWRNMNGFQNLNLQ